ncbi:unnamed protein product, partial [Brassica rapa]
MNNLSIFLCVVFCMISHVYGDIRIANELKFNKYLWISCFSGDDRMEPDLINYRHSRSFTAFKQVSPSDRGALWDWRAREKGIYLKV